MENVFKVITTVTIDKEKTAVYQTVKLVYLFNLELLPIDLGEQIYNLIKTNRDRDIYVRNTRTITTKNGNVEEFRTEYVITDDLETLKKKVAEV